MRKTAILFVFIAAVSFTCKEKQQEAPIEVSLVGKITFKKGDVTINKASADVGSTVNQGDVVETRLKSMAIIQFGEGSLITLRPKTEFVVSKIEEDDGTGKPLIELLQKNGFTFNKIKSGFANYKIKTPTSVAGVRGTSFSLVVRKDRSVVKLLEGKVHTVPVRNGKEIEKEAVDVEPGKKVVAIKNKKMAVKKMAKKETDTLAVLNKVEFVSKEEFVKPKTPEAEQPMIDVQPDVQEKILPGSSKVTAKKMTLADLKKKYGKLYTITTTDGKKIIGGKFQQKGSVMEIITINGKISLPASKIANVDQQE